MIVFMCYTTIVSSRQVSKLVRFSDRLHRERCDYMPCEKSEYPSNLEKDTCDTYTTEQSLIQETSESTSVTADIVPVSYFSSTGSYIISTAKIIISAFICIVGIYIYMSIRQVMNAAANAINHARESKVQTMNLLANYTQSSNGIIQPDTIISNNETLNGTLQTTSPVTPPEKRKCKGFLSWLITDCVY